MIDIKRRNLIAGAGLIAGAAAAGGLLPSQAMAAIRGSFRPGEIWLDTAGKPIQAHGGSVIVVDNIFYWYGENKEFTTGDLKIWTYGIRCYRSTDLYNWEDLGLIVPPDLKDRSSPLYPAAFLDRPHIVYNAKTKKFVCWIKMLSEYQTRAVLIADRITGPYTLVQKDILPVGMGAGDFDLVVSPDDAKGYMYFERPHSEMICADLTDDYQGLTGYYSTHFPRPGPPTVREAPAYFRRGDKHYLATSGTSGYFPNPSEIAVADTFHGPFTELGLLHRNDRSGTSFNSQISCIFRHPAKRELFIAMADRWMGPRTEPAFMNGDRAREVQQTFVKRFARSPQPLSPAEQQIMETEGGLKVNTSRSRYVWLPILFEGNRPYIDWRSEWSLSDFD